MTGSATRLVAFAVCMVGIQMHRLAEVFLCLGIAFERVM
jgi:hypothetical protein